MEHEALDMLSKQKVMPRLQTCINLNGNHVKKYKLPVNFSRMNRIFNFLNSIRLVNAISLFIQLQYNYE